MLVYNKIYSYLCYMRDEYYRQFMTYADIVGHHYQSDNLSVLTHEELHSLFEAISYKAGYQYDKLSPPKEVGAHKFN